MASLMTPQNSLRLLLLSLSIVILVDRHVAAQSSSVTYNRSQSTHTFRSKHGNFEFTGKAIKREGEYASFRTSNGTEIWLPTKYLSKADAAYLKYLSGDGPAPAGLSSSESDLASNPSGNDTPTSPRPSQFGGNDPAESSPSTTDNPEMEAKPADPMPGDADKIYHPGAAIEVLVDGQWHAGKVFVRRPADNAYFVSFTVNGVARRSWVPAVELRSQGEAEPMTSDTMSEANRPVSSPLVSYDFKPVKITAKAPIGYVVGPMNTGDVLKLRYVSGKWKSWGGLATESPDAVSPAGGDKCRLAICSAKGNEMPQTLTIVPGQTQDNAYTWTADQKYSKVILQINDTDGDFAANPERDVTYEIAIERNASP